MRFFISIVLLFIINCSTTVVEEVRYFPPQNFGCSNYIGKNRIDCINGLLSELENIKNSKPKIRELSKERKNENIVIVKKEICHGSLCFESEQELYDPSTWSKIKNFLLISLPSIVLGVIITTL